jgi:hypothetical protein
MAATVVEAARLRGLPYRRAHWSASPEWIAGWPASDIGIAYSRIPCTIRTPASPTRRNLTPDPDTGLGRWSDEQIVQAIRGGVNRHGIGRLLVMPWGAYSRMTDADGLRDRRLPAQSRAGVAPGTGERFRPASRHRVRTCTSAPIAAGNDTRGLWRGDSADAEAAARPPPRRPQRSACSRAPLAAAPRRRGRAGAHVRAARAPQRCCMPCSATAWRRSCCSRSRRSRCPSPSSSRPAANVCSTHCAT